MWRSCNAWEKRLKINKNSNKGLIRDGSVRVWLRLVVTVTSGAGGLTRRRGAGPRLVEEGPESGTWPGGSDGSRLWVTQDVTKGRG